MKVRLHYHLAISLFLFPTSSIQSQKSTLPNIELERFLRAREFRKSGDFENAVRLLEGVLDNEPNHSEAYGELGLSYLRLGQLDQAQESLETAITLDADLSNPHLYLAEVLVQKHDFIGASQVLLGASEVHPGRAEPYFLLAKMHLENGHLAAAEQAAHLALERDYSEVPEIHLFHLLMAEMHCGHGELRRAKLKLEFYLQKSPDGEEADKARASLEDVRFGERTGLPSGVDGTRPRTPSHRVS